MNPYLLLPREGALKAAKELKGMWENPFGIDSSEMEYIKKHSAWLMESHNIDFKKYDEYMEIERMKAQKAIYLLNAFSLQMVDTPCSVEFSEVDTLPEGLTSAIGHADTARVLGVEMNRVNVHLSKGDIAYVAQLIGGRLPEGSTTLPDGFKFKFIKVKVRGLI